MEIMKPGKIKRLEEGIDIEKMKSIVEKKSAAYTNVAEEQFDLSVDQQTEEFRQLKAEAEHIVEDSGLVEDVDLEKIISDAENDLDKAAKIIEILKIMSKAENDKRRSENDSKEALKIDPHHRKVKYRGKDYKLRVDSPSKKK